MVQNNSSDYQVTQYNVITGGASNVLNNVAPSATSGVPVISQGASSQPVFGTAVVAGGGTGVATLTGLALGSGTSAFTGVTYVPKTTFTPVLNFGGATTGITYSVQGGIYTQIGNCVYFELAMTLSSVGSATGTATITGLPVTSGTSGATFPINIISGGAAAVQVFWGYLSSSATSMSINYVIAGSSTQLTNANFNNATNLQIQGLYFT